MYTYRYLLYKQRFYYFEDIRRIIYNDITINFILTIRTSLKIYLFTTGLQKEIYINGTYIFKNLLIYYWITEICVIFLQKKENIIAKGNLISLCKILFQFHCPS